MTFIKRATTLRTGRHWTGLYLALFLGALGPTVISGPPFALADAVLDADVAQNLSSINQLTGKDETLDLMRQEGIKQGKLLGSDMFGTDENAEWLLALDRVYDLGRMSRIYDAALAEVLMRDPALVSDVTPFLGAELGARIVDLELEARRTALDDVAMGAAREVLDEMERTDRARRAQIERLVVSADLIETNVTAGLNGNIAFFQALAEAGAPGAVNDEEEMLAQVWSREAEIRASTADFLYPLMALAYAPLSEAELESYAVFSESPEGRRFNAAMAQAFTPVMIDLSRALGAEAGRMLSGQVL